MKKIIAALLSLSLVIGAVSCSSSEKTAEDTEKVTETVTEEAQTEETEEAEEENAPGFDASKLVYDFEGLDSGECMKILTSGKYHVLFRYVYMGENMFQELYYNDNSMIITTDFMNTSYTMLYKDKMQYTISDDIYYKLDANGEDIGSGDMFEAFGYVESGTTELDGKTYKYDEYYQTTTDSFTQVLMTDDNKIYAFQSGDQLMYIEKYDADFDPAEKIKIPDGAKEVSAEEFNTQFMNKMANSVEAASSEDGEEQISETEEQETPEE